MLPPIDFKIDRTSEPDGSATLAPVYAGHGVEQSLGDPASPILRARVWAAAGLGGPPVPITLSLVAGDTNEPIRQATFNARPGSQPVSHDVEFQPYDSPQGRELKLQFVVSPEAQNFVAIGIGARDEDLNGAFAQPRLNGQPLEFLAPVAFRLEGHGIGLRAAIFHGGSERARLVGAALAFLGAGVIWLAGARIGRALLGIPSLAQARGPGGRRFFFYPWLVAAFPVAHFYRSNIVVFDIAEVLPAFAASLIGVSLLVAAGWTLWRDLATASAVAAVIWMVVTAYGHVQDALGQAVEHSVLLPIAVALGLLLAMAVVVRARFAVTLGRFLNYASVPLVAIPAVGAMVFLTTGADADVGDIEIPATARSAPFKPDIYYLILDSYGRADVLAPFDNGTFLDALRERGFYVATDATSNYPKTDASLPSALNMRYLDPIDEWNDEAIRRGQRLMRDHLVGRVLTELGYRYVHLSSGFSSTDSNERAHVLVDFAPSGVIMIRNDRGEAGSDAEPQPAPGRATREFARTTILRPFANALLGPSADERYGWAEPGRALGIFDFLKTVHEFEGPLFVLAHVIKPHFPYTFDQYGNIAPNPQGFGPEHDPSVPGPYFGQLLHVNSLVLDAVDAILSASGESPVIVITSDHGASAGTRESGGSRFAILAAYLLPKGGDLMLYPSISSVNNFRVILDYYFGLGLGVLEDRTVPFITRGLG